MDNLDVKSSQNLNRSFLPGGKPSGGAASWGVFASLRSIHEIREFILSSNLREMLFVRLNLANTECLYLANTECLFPFACVCFSMAAT